MSARRRGGLAGWLTRLKGYQLVVGFLGLALTLGTGLVAGATSFERRWGILAANFGFARQASVTHDLRALKVETKTDNAKILAAVDRIQLWQLYDQIKRTQRNIDNLKEKKTLTPVERDQLQDFSTQLVEATRDYQRLVERVRAPGP